MHTKAKIRRLKPTFGRTTQGAESFGRAPMGVSTESARTVEVTKLEWSDSTIDRSLKTRRSSEAEGQASKGLAGGDRADGRAKL
jgi:hypothetical protein